LDAAPRDRVVWRPWSPGHVSHFGLIRPANSPMSRPAALLASIVTEIFERRYGQNMREA
jgi:hypothetical protein